MTLGKPSRSNGRFPHPMRLLNPRAIWLFNQVISGNSVRIICCKVPNKDFCKKSSFPCPVFGGVLVFSKNIAHMNKDQFIGHHPVVSVDTWLEARKELLRKEKAFTRLRDQLSAERRALPWVRIDKPYVFDSPEGKKTLADLFAGRTQLLIKHFMMGPGWKEGCVG